MRVLVTGSRTLEDRMIVFNELHQLKTEHDDLIIRHGACPRGADRWAEEWCDYRNVPQERYPANWSLGKAAGHIRNAQMFNDGGVDLVLAFPRGEAKGTMNAVNLAGKFGIPVRFG